MHPTSRPSPTGSSSSCLRCLPCLSCLPCPHGRPARRRPPPDHHLWRNGGRWWIAIVLVTTDGRRQRLRRSLGTADVVVARARRDDVLRRLATSKHWRPAHDALASRAGAAHGEAA